jgi:cytochrome P450
VASYGDLAYLRLPGTDAYLINRPDLVWDVFVTGSRDFGKGPTIQAAKLLLGESVLTSEEPLHMRQRRLVNPIFHHDRIQTYAAAMVEHASRRSETWRDGEVRDIHREMAMLTLAVVASTVFATDVSAGDSAVVTGALTDILAMMERIYSPLFRLTIHLPLPTTRRFERRKAELDAVVLRMIAERRAAGAGGKDVLSLLLRAQEDGVGMSDEQVRNEALTLFLAGHETTANALTWTWWLLSEHPEAEERLHAELDAVLGDRPPTGADLARLPFAEAVLSESIRLRPPAWAIGRIALAEHEVGGYRVGAGSVVVVSPFLLHHDARWFAEPEAFRPERWLTGETEGRPRGAFLPFGTGPRQCLGEGFAWTEARLVLATLARRWRLRLVPGHPVVPQPSVTLRPKHGMVMRLERRAS